VAVLALVAVETAAVGALDAAVDGALEADADGAAEAAVDGALDAAAVGAVVAGAAEAAGALVATAAVVGVAEVPQAASAAVPAANIPSVVRNWRRDTLFCRSIIVLSFLSRRVVIRRDNPCVSRRVVIRRDNPCVRRNGPWSAALLPDHSLIRAAGAIGFVARGTDRQGDATRPAVRTRSAIVARQ